MALRPLGFVCAVLSATLTLPLGAQPPQPQTDSNLNPQVVVVTSDGLMTLYSFANGTFAQVAQQQTDKSFIDVEIEDMDGDDIMDIATIQLNADSEKEAMVWGYNPAGHTFVQKAVGPLDIDGDLVGLAVPTVTPNTIVVLFHVAGDEDHIRVFEVSGGDIATHPIDSGSYPVTNGGVPNNLYDDIAGGDVVTPDEATVGVDDVLVVHRGRPALLVNELLPRGLVASRFRHDFLDPVAIECLLPDDPPAAAGGGDLYALLAGDLRMIIMHTNAPMLQGAIYPDTDLGADGLTGIDCAAANLGGTADALAVLYAGDSPTAYRALRAVQPTPPATIDWLGDAVRVADTAVACDGARTGLLPLVPTPSQARHWTFQN
ncbi:MAG TPA: hypothetical protein PLS90_13350 [Candidatus Sumerlaeota bacterium]|nr:hypothetical protein [Candidatus Sumerlaeota bacterium]